MRNVILILAALIVALLVCCELEAAPYNCGPNGCGPAYGRAPVSRGAFARVRRVQPLRRALAAPFRLLRGCR